MSETKENLNLDCVNKRECDDCEKLFKQDDLVKLDCDWFVCQECFEGNSEGNCSWSSYCNYTGSCDNAC
tara:strand:+ start:875 stop:1081 length:207 start_codon:yes stop_codon:yes gene_type:complete